MTAHPLDALIDDALPSATQLAVTVRDRDASAVAAVLGPLLDAGHRDRIAALIIALAVLVPDDATFSELIAWTHGQDQLPYGQLVIAPGEKWCAGCQQVRSVRDFGVDRSKRDGLRSRCKHCRAELKAGASEAPAERGAA
ncbi:hypothetical protein GCM10023085_45890 [Actinomadura viridis]|uniref:Uncharacterized protein n=1 Tax=Actinomadura viridis TaxID=58110 RepID=A0A931DJM6_9ACTN|nr:hypothetical protein [Actinomadura viridis]MBG6089949.1 hypothetical protein [Actinomadura viridis]